MRRLPYHATVQTAARLAVTAFATAVATAVATACATAPVAAPPSPSAARPGSPTTVPAPTPKSAAAVALPPIAPLDGPLSIKVVYPRPNQEIQVRDSNFIFGSVGSGKATLSINGYAVPVAPNGAFLGFLPVPRGEQPAYELVALNGVEKASATVIIRGPASIAPPKPNAGPLIPAVQTTELSSPRLAELISADNGIASDTDRVVILRPTPTGTYKWFLFPGTTLEVTAERGTKEKVEMYRVRLDAQLEAWVAAGSVRLLPEGTIAPRRSTLNVRVANNTATSDVRIPITGERPPYDVSETRDAITLTLYGTTANSDIINLATTDPTVRNVTWEQVTTDRARYTVHLRHPPVGYGVTWERNAVVLHVRHALLVDAARPLAGRIIAVDPGHPPDGTTGPTGLYEGDATLMIAEQLKPLLEARGATVFMTRTTRGAVPLGDRPVMARRAGADVFVSIHLNAFGDGTNPFRANGTGTYFFRDQSEPLARAVQMGLTRQLGLRDLGINYDNLAVVRSTWMPAILCEGMFAVIPEQENALRTVEFQKRYAMGIVEGLEEYFRSMAASR
jgi:N-acetylmuramoyl-L-alanine amidase